MFFELGDDEHRIATRHSHQYRREETSWQCDKKEQQTPHSQGGKSAIHLVHAWCHELQLCLAQYKTDSKSNEITAIPAILDFLEISGCIITLDAMGCQKTIAEKIITKQADYIMGLKDNQAGLSLATFTAFQAHDKQAENNKAQQEDKNHGREELRTCRVLPAELLQIGRKHPIGKG